MNCFKPQVTENLRCKKGNPFAPACTLVTVHDAFRDESQPKSFNFWTGDPCSTSATLKTAGRGTGIGCEYSSDDR